MPHKQLSFNGILEQTSVVMVVKYTKNDHFEVFSCMDGYPSCRIVRMHQIGKYIMYNAVFSLLHCPSVNINNTHK